MQTDRGKVSHSQLRAYWLYVSPLPMTLYAVMRGWPPKPTEVVVVSEASDMPADFLERMGQ